MVSYPQSWLHAISTCSVRVNCLSCTLRKRFLLKKSTLGWDTPEHSERWDGLSAEPKREIQQDLHFSQEDSVQNSLAHAVPTVSKSIKLIQHVSIWTNQTFSHWCWSSAPETLRNFLIYTPLPQEPRSLQSKSHDSLRSGCKPCCDWVLHRLLHAKRDAHDPTKSTECGWCLRWTSLETGTHCWLLISYPEKKHPSWTTLTAHLFDPVRMLSRFAWHEVQTKSCTNSSQT